MEENDKRLAPPAGIDALCASAAGAGFGDLSENNLRLFKDRLLDITGCMFGGSIVKEDAFLTARLRDWGGKPEAPVFTRDFRLPLPAAVMLNCLYARANDFGCMFFRVGEEHIASHCGETLFPLGLTLADVYGVSGRDFAVRHIAAEDLTARILYTLPVRWPLDMLLVSTAAAALASRYYGFDGPQMKTALSFAAVNCTDPANAYYDYSQEFKYHNAESARMGVMAAELTRGGWRGLEDPYFGHWGLVARQTGDGGLPPLYARAFDGLGRRFYTEESFKRYPGGIPTTAAANAGKILRAQIEEADGRFDAGRVRRVRVYRSAGMRYNYYSQPFTLRSHTNALFSFGFSACCALYYGAVDVEKVQTDAIRAQPELCRLAEGATVDVYSCEPGRSAVKVTAEMTDGRLFAAEADYGGAMHEYPGREFLEEKFRAQVRAAGTLTKAAADKLIELDRRLEELPDMREYTRLLTL